MKKRRPKKTQWTTAKVLAVILTLTQIGEHAKQMLSTDQPKTQILGVVAASESLTTTASVTVSVVRGH